MADPTSAEAGASSASGFDPAREFPNIVWNFDNLQDPAAAATATAVPTEVAVPDPESDVEMSGRGIMTAPPTPSAPPSAQPTAEAASPAKKARSTPAKRKAAPEVVAVEGSSRKKAKTANSRPKSDARQKPSAPVAPAAPKEDKVKARAAKNLARKETKRDNRRLKRKEIRSKHAGEGRDQSAGAEEVVEVLGKPEVVVLEAAAGDAEDTDAPESKAQSNATGVQESASRAAAPADKREGEVSEPATQDAEKVETPFSGRMTRRRAKMAGTS
ncbi:hypothetical protein BKA67DRAFT_171848 [Truncatella angustata]|uniref:Uncharacterized protein n=1 Tax=Truncatella angustata TaxID=152316 RepID=A0A9P8UQZ1_9PEZI|nr:uncharacterized protein BKA67DRAFT_171848 [Truncatella angustata]KAH6656847.1 hypothetical protein BKA67DRAFT_171848 [Truncatella angustata]KAH8193885.1 hypothetical protein TruAng_011951 [Truncatella angustata]